MGELFPSHSQFSAALDENSLMRVSPRKMYWLVLPVPKRRDILLISEQFCLTRQDSSHIFAHNLLVTVKQIRTRGDPIRANALLLTAALLTGQLFAQRPVELADPFAGTSGDHGQTFPGAILPFGMVVVNPDTYPSSLNHDAHAGYNYEDKKIVGFSHFRMSGVGCEGLGGILSILPLLSDPSSLDPAAYAQAYDKPTEIATPGNYAVRLMPSSILAELTVTQHASLHRYTFPPNAAQTLLLDLRRGSQSVDEAEIARSPGRIWKELSGPGRCATGKSGSQGGTSSIFISRSVPGCNP